MRRGLIVGGLVALAAVLAGWFFASPVLAARSLQAALQAGDRDRIEQLVDFPSVRKGLKADLKDIMMARLRSDPELRDNPFAGLGELLVPALTNRVVDAAVTPDGLARLSRGESIEIDPVGGDDGPVAGRVSGPVAGGEKESKLTYGYRGLNRFVAVQPTDEGELTWIMQRKGLFGWELVRIELPRALIEGASGGATP